MDGKVFQKSFGPFSFIGKKSIDQDVELLVETKRPEKAMTRGYVTFASVMIPLLFFTPLFAPLLILFWCIPVIARAKRSEKVTGRIVEFTTGRRDYSPSVEYKYNGELFETQLDTWSSFRPIIGGSMEIKIDTSNPHRIVSKSELVFSIFATVIFCLMGLLFASIGFFAKMDSAAPEEIPLLGYIIPYGLIFIFLMIGIIYCLRVKRELSKVNLRKTGVPVSCVIQKFSVNTFAYVQGGHPATLSCVGGGKTFNLKTNIHPMQKNIHTGARVMVYVDQMNDKRFYVDLSSVRDDF